MAKNNLRDDLDNIVSTHNMSAPVTIKGESEKAAAGIIATPGDKTYHSLPVPGSLKNGMEKAQEKYHKLTNSPEFKTFLSRLYETGFYGMFGNFQFVNKDMIYLGVAKTDGHSLDKAIMFQTDVMLNDPNSGNSSMEKIIWSPVNYESKIRSAANKMGVSDSAVDNYAWVHEFVHALQTTDAKARGVNYAEGTADFLILMYAMDVLINKKDLSAKEKTLYMDVLKLADNRLKMNAAGELDKTNLKKRSLDSKYVN